MQCNVVEYSAEQWRLDLGPEDDAAVEPPGEGEEQHGQDRQEAEEDLGGRHHRLTRHRHCHQHNHRQHFRHQLECRLLAGPFYTLPS